MALQTRPVAIGILFFLCLALAGCGGVAESVAQPAATNTPAPVEASANVGAQIASVSEPAAVSQSVPETMMEPKTSITHISFLGQDTVIAGAQSTLTRMEHGVYMTFDTAELPPGEAYTIWWVIFNRPENCSDGLCGVNDMAMTDDEGSRLYNDDGSPRPNLPQREATQFSLLRAVGHVVDIDGTVEFRAHLPVGDAIETEFGPGLLDPMGAEIHLVARTHGMAIPGAVHDQLNSAWGGCPEGWPKDPCGDKQVAIHKAAQD